MNIKEIEELATQALENHKGVKRMNKEEFDRLVKEDLDGNPSLGIWICIGFSIITLFAIGKCSGVL